MPKGYTTNALVAAELGVTLTAPQITQVDGLIEEAEALVDRYTARSWIVTSPASELVTIPDDGLVYLLNRPVSAITSVLVRSTAIGATDTTLVADSTYELLDPANGALLVSTGYRGYLATVTYTHANGAAAVPGDIRRATTLIVAGWFAPSLVGAAATAAGLTGVESLSLGSGEIAIKYGAAASGGGRDSIPDQAMHILRGRQRVLLV